MSTLGGRNKIEFPGSISTHHYVRISILLGTKACSGGGGQKGQLCVPFSPELMHY